MIDLCQLTCSQIYLTIERKHLGTTKLELIFYSILSEFLEHSRLNAQLESWTPTLLIITQCSKASVWTCQSEKSLKQQNHS